MSRPWLAMWMLCFMSFIWGLISICLKYFISFINASYRLLVNCHVFFFYIQCVFHMSHPIFTCIILISLRLNLFVCSVRTQNKLYPILLFLQISYLPPPWEDCGSVPLKDTPYYSRKSCHFECETDFIVDKCGCQLLSMRRRGVPVCHPLNETQCAVPAKHAYMEQGWPCAQYVQHYSDVIMGTMASQITSLTIVYWTVYSGADQRKRKSSASLAFVGEICRWPGKSLHKGPATRKCFHFNDVIMVICDIIFLCVYYVYMHCFEQLEILQHHFRHQCLRNTVILIP